MSGFFVPNAGATIATLTITSPNGGEQWSGTHNITWTYTGGAPGDLVNIVYSTDDFASQAVIATNVPYDTGSYSWNTASLPDGGNYKIRFIDSSLFVYDTSDSNFRIDNTPPIVDAGADKMTNALFTQDATASDPAPSSGIASYLWTRQSGLGTITFGTPNAEDTTISADADGTYIIKLTVTDVAGNSNFDIMQLIWDTTPPSVPTVLNPNGGNYLKGGSSYNITWTPVTDVNLGPTPIKIEYSALGNFSDTVILSASEANDGSYSWTVPSSNLATAKIKITATDLIGNSSNDISDAAFTIDSTNPTITASTLLTPSAAVIYLKGGSDYEITWSNGGITDANLGTNPIKIEYAADGSTFVTVADNETNDGSYTWHVPSDNTSAAKIRITATDLAGNSSNDVSDNSFTVDSINPVVSVSTPTTVTRTNPATLTASVIDTNSVTCTYRIDSGAETPIACTGGSIAVTDGKHTFTVTATDVAGNIGSGNRTAVIDLNSNLTVGTGKDFTTIQEAVDNALSGDTITIDPGSYPETVTINGKNLTLNTSSGTATANSFTLANTAVSGSTNVTAPIVNVNSGAKIQDGVLLTSSSGTVNVAAGSYTESLTINKSLTLQGAGSSLVTVTGNQTVTVSNVTLDGFTFNGTVIVSDASSIISGGTISHNIITGSGVGIRLGATSGLGIDHITIRDNNITGNSGKGILFYNSSDYVSHHISYITINNNQITNNTDSGISTYGPGPNTITNNTVSGNTGNGISIKYDDGDVISGNTVTGNAAMGINMHQVTNTVVENNSVSGHVNPDVVTTFWGTLTGVGKGSAIYIHENSNGNTIRLNTLINNKIGVLISRESAGTDPANNSINNNTITDNSVYGVLNALVSPASPADAANNWWGAVSGPYHSPENTAGTGNAVSDNVDYSKWCTDIGCTTFGSSDPIDHFNIVPLVVSAVVNVPITLTVTAKDAANITRVNDTSVVSMAADHGASLGTLLLTLVSGVKDTTVVNSVTGTVNVSGIKVGGSATGSTSVEFVGSDLIAPTVLSQTPTDGLPDVVINISPTVTFSEAMDANSVNGSTVKLRLYSDDSVISSTISLNDTKTIVTINPVSNLLNSTNYYLWVSGATDVAGNTITAYITKANQEFTTTADTSDLLAPTITAQTPTDNSVSISIGVAPTLTFSEAMDAATLNGGTIQLRAYTGDTPVAASILYNSSTFVVTITPNTNLSYSTQYYLYVSGAKDVAGNTESTDYTATTKADHEFTTAADSADHTAPTIDSQTPTDGSTGIAVTIAPTLTFSEAMDASTLNGGTVQLRKHSDNSAVSASILYNSSTFVVTVTPTANLSNSTQYYLYVSGAKDVAGNTESTDYTTGTKDSHEFTTVAIQPIIVDEIVVQNSTADATNLYLDGWHYTFRITVNTAETNLSVKFTDWINSASSTQTVAANGNMRLLFNTSTGNGLGSIVGLTDADIIAGVGPIHSFALGNLYTDQLPGAINLGVFDTSTDPGRQIKFDVFTKLPVTTAPGFYETVFGIKVE